jgi:tetratricopeptide (TPR) repeat protein
MEAVKMKLLLRLGLTVAVIAGLLNIAPAVFAGIEEYKKAAELDGNSVVKRYNLGYAYYNDGMFDQAIDTLKQTLDMNAPDKESHAKVDATCAQILGIIYFNNKQNFDEALKYFNKVAEMKPSDGDNYYYMGLAYSGKGDYDRAIASFTEGIAKGTENAADADYRIGQAYFKKDKSGDAISFLEKAVAKSPKSETALDAQELLGIIYNKRDDSDRAIASLTAVVKARPENVNAYYVLGLNYFKQKKYDKMLAAYKKAITIKPDYADAHYNLGMAYYYRNEYEDAISEFEEAKKYNANDASTFSILATTKTAAYEFHLSKGSIALTEEKYLDAVKELNLALAAKPGDAEAQKYLANANDALSKIIPEKLKSADGFYRAGKYAEAYNDWDFVIQASPDNSEAKEGIKKIENNLSGLIAGKEKAAQNEIAQGNYDAAILEYRSIENVATESKKKEIAARIAGIREKQNGKVSGLLSAAEKAYAKKDYSAALNKYNDILKFNQGNEAALNGITKVNAQKDSDKEKFLAKARQNSGSDKAKAATYFKKVLEIDPTNQEANSGIEQATGRTSKLALDAKQIKELYYQGVDRYVNGDIEEAIKIWKKVLAIDSGHVEAQKNIKRAQEKLAAIKNLSR